MGRIQNFIQNALGISNKEQAPAKPLVPFVPVEEGIFSTSELNTEAQLEQYKSWVYAAVSKIAQECSSIEVTLMEMDANGEVKKVEGTHPVKDLLDSVNPFTTFSDLVEITKTYELLSGDAFWWLLKGNGGEVIEIWQYLRPDLVSVVPSKENFIKEYKYKVPGEGNVIKFDVDEIIQFKRPNPLNPYRGVSPVKAGEWAIGTDRQASEYNWRFFGNNARPDLIFNFPDGVDNEQAKLIRTQWENAHRGTKNSHKVGILSKGEVQNIGLSQKDMEFLKQRQFSRDEILTMFKVPKAILDPQEVNYASAQTAKNIFMEQVIIPEMTRFVNTLNEFLLPHFNDDRLFFDFEDPREQDAEITLKRYETLAKVGAISPNEIRQMEGLEPMEGGDEIRPAPAGNTENIERRFKGIIGKPRSRSTSAEMIEKIKKELKSETLKKKQSIKLTENGDKIKTEREKWADKYFEKQDREIMKDEREFSKLLAGEFQRQKKGVVKSLEEKTLSFSFNVEAETKEFEDVFKSVNKALVAKYGERALEELGLSGFDMTSNAKNYLKNDALIFAKAVNETTKLRITNILKRAEEAGTAIGVVSKEIATTFDDWSDIKNPGARARSIAHTETARSANFATVEGWKQSGVVRAKEWFANPGACPICEPRHGKTIGLDKTYSFPEGITDSSFGDVSEPPAHVNCRCLTLPVVIKKSEQLMMYKKKLDELDMTIKEVKEKGEKTVEELRYEGERSISEVREVKDKLDEIIDEEKEDDKQGS